MNYIDLIPSKDISEYLKKIDYKVDMYEAFYLTFMFADDNKLKKEGFEQIIKTFPDEPHTYPRIDGKEEVSTYHTMIKNYMKELDLKEGEEAPDEIPDLWLHIPFWVYDLPVPFNDGDVLCKINKNESPILIRKIIDSDKSKLSISDEFENDGSFLHSYAYYEVLEDGRIIESVIGFERENTENGGNFYFEYYKGNFDGKYKKIKELRDAYKNGRLDEELAKYNVEDDYHGKIYSER